MSVYQEIASCDARGCLSSISCGDSLVCQSCYDELLTKIESLEETISKLEQKIEDMEYDAKEERD